MTIRLPSVVRRATELFSGRAAAENSALIEWNLQAPDSALFELEL